MHVLAEGWCKPGPPEFSWPQNVKSMRGRDSCVAVVYAAQGPTVWLCDLPEVHTIFSGQKGLERLPFGVDHTLLNLHDAASPFPDVLIAEFAAMAVFNVEHGIFWQCQNCP